jgi:hypothetical protein
LLIPCAPGFAAPWGGQAGRFAEQEGVTMLVSDTLALLALGLLTYRLVRLLG